MNAKIPTLIHALQIAGLCWLGPWVAAEAAAAPREIKLATILPRGLGQDTQLTKLGQDWSRVTEGAFTLRKAPGGQKDGEAGIVKKLRSGNYQAALLSAVGLSEIDREVRALQMMPLAFRSWDEVDFVRERIRGSLEQRLRDKGFEVLLWADAGWVTFFSKQAAYTPDDFRRLRIWVWAGESEQVGLMKAIGYQPIALETDHLHTSLAAGMIDAAPVTPIFALGAQVHTVAPHMLELNWVPIVGAIIVRSEVWASIPAPVRAKLQALHEEAGRQLRDEGRRFHDEAVKTLRRGPKTQVHSPSPAQRLEWQKLAEELGPQVRDRIVPAATYDRVQALLAEYRAGKS